MSNLNYIAIARKDIGLREIKGPQHAPRISAMLRKVDAWWRDDETPWCGVALAAWFEEAGLPYPKAYYRALSWLDYGKAAGMQYGAIAVLKRKGGGHVGIVTGMTHTGSHVRLLGGNQNDMVCEMWFPIDRIAAFRLPLGAIDIPTPIATLGRLSKSEA